MHHELRTYATPEELAEAAADVVAERLRAAIAEHGHARAALSGGKSPWLMFERLATRPLDWASVTLYQVDERVAPDGSDERNSTHVESRFTNLDVTFDPMDVTADDLEGAARRYEESLPARFDLIHLGIGPDGHCASLIPGDPVLDVRDRRVALTGAYQSTRRMTLTYPALADTDQLLWLIEGADKREPLAKLLASDPSIPAGRVEAEHSLILASRDALEP